MSCNRLTLNKNIDHSVIHAVVEVGMFAIHGTVREGEGSARVNISILQGSLGDVAISFIVSTADGTAQGKLHVV